jgi:small subunit ribosomal protein S13
MVRIAGIDLPRTKRIEYALTSIYGIGLTSSQSILDSTNIDKNIRVNELQDADVISLRETIEQRFQVEEDLRRTIKQNILRLSQINCVKGRRHRAGLPLRGQRTRTNSRTRRGRGGNR